MFCHGVRDVRNCPAMLLGAGQIPVTAQGCIDAIRYILHTTGDRAGLDGAMDTFTEQLPHTLLASKFCGTPINRRIGCGNAMEVGILQEISLHALLVQAYQTNQPLGAAGIVLWDAYHPAANAWAALGPQVKHSSLLQPTLASGLLSQRGLLHCIQTEQQGGSCCCALRMTASSLILCRWKG